MTKKPTPKEKRRRCTIIIIAYQPEASHSRVVYSQNNLILYLLCGVLFLIISIIRTVRVRETTGTIIEIAVELIN